MNDHIDPDLMCQAKKWADKAVNRELPDSTRAAVDLVLSLPDHIIDADNLRERAKLHRKWAEEDSDIPGMKNTHTLIADALESLLPTSSLSTLADLIERGHDPAQYQWMQAEWGDDRCIIIRINGQTTHPTVSLLTAPGATIWASTDEVIPLPDLPRLVWPAESPLEPAEEPSTPEVASKVLVTGEDYENAPYGTICAEDGHFPLYTSTWTWYTIGGDSHNHSDLAGTPRRVLRWGMGEQA